MTAVRVNQNLGKLNKGQPEYTKKKSVVHYKCDLYFQIQNSNFSISSWVDNVL